MLLMDVPDNLSSITTPRGYATFTFSKLSLVLQAAAETRSRSGDASQFPAPGGVGIGNVSVVIAPYDMRAGRTAELEKSPLDWYPALCDEIAAALK